MELEDYIKTLPGSNYLITKETVKDLLKVRNKFSNKGDYGHALLITGSYGKMGASVLASEACIRSGVGLLTVYTPKCGYNILQISVPEAMIDTSSSENFISGVIYGDKYDAIGIGPGIGTEKETQQALKLLIQNSSKPIIFDADALNILSENKTWLSFVPKNSILTPHAKEFERLFGAGENDLERYQLQKDSSIKYGTYIVLKGAHTSISTPTGSFYFNTTGNPGMATAGSGDVLTGIITGLKAQGYSSQEAAIIGVYLHGLAGDFAAARQGVEAMLAGDIVKDIGTGFKFLHED